jgi:hypothetical protein
MNINQVRNTVPQPTLTTLLKKTTASQFQTDIATALTVQPKEESPKESPSILTNSEREYFEQLFPASAEEVRRYNPYQKDGGKVEIRLGTLLDRKG